MKVLAVKENIGPTYICEVSHRELEMFLNLYYGKLSQLKVDQVVDLGKGYNYAEKISRAMKNIQDLIQNNGDIVRAILDGLTITARLCEESNDDKTDTVQD